MKIRLVLLVNLFAFLSIYQFYLAVSSNRIEDRSSYKVIHTHKNFEIRMYNPIAVEVINAKAYRFKEYSRYGIKNLDRFGIIDGQQGNAFNSEKLSGSLITQNLNSNSKAHSSVTKNNNLYLAVITFDGFAFESDIKSYAKTMVLALKKSNIRHFGNFQYVGYNSRFQFFRRRNEVIVHINY
ncbi:MAG: heme-binding protein [Leadbetterella sp.]|nr:heme-binding protein [Leadbetterella sp.]